MESSKNTFKSENKTTNYGQFGETLICLVHGVGLPSENQFGKILPDIIGNLKIASYRIVRFDWHAKVDHPISAIEFLKPILNHKQLAGLMSGTIGAANIWGLAKGKTIEVLIRASFFLALVSPAMILLTTACLLGHFGGQFQDAHFAIKPMIVINYLLFSKFLFDIIVWLLILYWSVVIVVYCSIPFIAFFGCGLKGVLSGLRVIALRLLWPAVFCFALLFTWPGAIFAYLYMQVIGYSVFAPDTSSLSLDKNFVPIVWPDEATAYIVVGAASIPLTIAGFASVKILYNSTLRIAWPLKVVADVTRFLGDSSYSAYLTDFVASELRNETQLTPNPERLILIGHSLGSIIALRSLLECKGFLPSETKVYFVTMGSPLKRLICRFFPGAIMDADTAAIALKAMYNNFSWINVYRPFDPIGTRLFTRKTDYTMDVSTGQKNRILGLAHENYWDDRVVTELVVNSIKLLEQMPSNEVGDKKTEAEEIHKHRDPNCYNGEFATKRHRGASKISRITVGGMLLIISSNIIINFNPYQLNQSAKNTRILEASHAPTVPGKLYVFEELVRQGSNQAPYWIPLDRFFIVFTPIGTTKPVIYSTPPSTLSSQSKDYATRFGTETRLKRRWSTESVVALYISVKVRHLPDNPAIFDLPEYGPVDENLVFVERAVFIFLLLIMAIVPVYVIGIGLTYFMEIYLGNRNGSLTDNWLFQLVLN